MIFPPTQDGLALGLGGAPLGNLYAALSDAQAQAIPQAALATGCRTFDTAPHYGNGLSEHRFGEALRRVPRDGFVLSTKVGRLLHARADAPRDQNSYVDVLPFVQEWNFSAAGVRRSVEDSLQRLGLARLDVVYVHDCDATVHGAAYPRVLAQVVQEALPELRRMQQEGLLRHIGLGVNDVQVCLDVLRQADLDCLMLAGRYSLIDHSGLDTLLPLCAQRGVRIALGGVFNSGILATGVRHVGEVRFNYGPASSQWVQRVDAVEGVCAEFGVPLRAAALQFPLAHPAVETVMLGADKPEQWHDALRMMAHSIPAAFWEALRAKGLLPAEGAHTAGAPMIDAHFHIWQLARGDYGWLTPEMGSIHRDVALDDWRRVARPCGITAGIVVQAAPTEAETRFLLQQAAAAPDVLGVVGWVDMLAPDAAASVRVLAAEPKLKGLRPMLQDIADPDWILQRALEPALEALQQCGLTFDALVKPVHLPRIAELVARHPGLRVVIDHAAKPDIAHGQWQDWAGGMERLARAPQVFCKLSGLWTEAAPGADAGVLRPYASHVLQTFGAARTLWGSDWPVLELAGGYAEWHAAALEQVPAAERAQVFDSVARLAYGLP